MKNKLMNLGSSLRRIDLKNESLKFIKGGFKSCDSNLIGGCCKLSNGNTCFSVGSCPEAIGCTDNGQNCENCNSQVYNYYSCDIAANSETCSL